MIVGPGTLQDFGELAQNLSDLHADELRRAAALMNTTVSFFIDAMAVWMDAHGATVAKRGGKVVAMWSHAPHPHLENTDAIWFLATKAFFDDMVANFRACRRQIGEEQKQIGKELTVLSWSLHPKAEQWGRLIGFDKIQPEGMALRFTRTLKSG